MFADESDEVCRLCYHLSSTFTEGVGRITASDQTVQAVHSCISWLSSLFKQTNKCMESYSFVQTIWISGLNKQNSPYVDKAVDR